MNISYEHIDELDTYFSEIRKIRLLTREEEKNLARKSRNGDKKAFDKLLRHNLRFVVNIAKQYRDRGVPFADLISEGNFGLMKAIEKYDETREVRLVAYAASWIRVYITNYIRKYTKNTEQSCDDLMVYLDMQHQGEYINTEFEEELLDIESRRSSVDELLKCLHNREKKILMLFYGLNGNKEMTLDEIGKETNLTMERVRQIKDKAMMKLKCSALAMNSKEIETLRNLR